MANNILEGVIPPLVYIDGAGIAKKGFLFLGKDGDTPRILAVDSEGNLKSTITDINISDQTTDLKITLDGEEVTITGYDIGTNSNQVSVLNPDWAKYTDPESLVSASDIGATDNTWVDQGSEIDCRGYKILSFFVVLTVNNSTGNQLQILSKTESGGADEYTLETTADYQKTIGDSDIKVVYTFNVEGIPFVQLQTKATLVGATEGTVSIDIVKEY